MRNRRPNSSKIAVKKSVEHLDIESILGEFRKIEESPSRRKGTFKIDKPFNQALDTILKTRTEPKKAGHR